LGCCSVPSSGRAASKPPSSRHGADDQRRRRESTAVLGTRTSTVSGAASAYAAACGIVSCSVASSTRRSELAESRGCKTASQPNGCTKPPSSASVGA